MTGGPECGRAAGFSLVEMLVVLAILALAAGIGVLSIRTIVPSQRLAAMAERIAGEIALLRTEAQRTGRVTRLVYDGETHRFLGSRPGVPAIAMAGWAIRFETATASRTQGTQLRFFPDGGSTGARITLSGPGGTRILSVSRATGVVRQAEANP